MALSKNKTGIMAAISAAAAPQDTQERAQRTLPKGTIGSVRAGLGGIQEIDTKLIIPWGPQDRLVLTAVNSDEAVASVQELADSIKNAGQQVPVLLRPSGEKDGHFEVIYGRRRILACRQLGQPVKALIRTLDDAEALLAKGLENASRAELSFYERARFAKAILEQGYPRAEVCQALAISKQTLSQLERVTRLIPDGAGDAIGSAPGAGRPKWMALAGLFEAKQMTQPQTLKVLRQLGPDADSDARLEAVLKDPAHRGPRNERPTERNPTPGVKIKNSKSSLSMSVTKTGDTAAFADWLETHLDGLIETAFDRFQSENRESSGS